MEKLVEMGSNSPIGALEKANFNYNESKVKKVWPIVFQPKIETSPTDL